MRSLLAVVLACAGVASAATAQAQLSLHASLTDDYDAVLVNPALLAGHRTTLRIGSVHSAGALNYAPNELGDEVDGDLLLRPRLSRANVDRPLEAFVGYQLQSVGLNVRRDGHQFGLHHRVRLDAELDAPGALVRLGVEGNAPLAGSELEVLPQGDVMLYHEIGLHYGRSLTPKLAVGARMKLLAGSAHVGEFEGSARVTTAADDYRIDYALAAAFRTAGTDFDLDAETYEFDLDAGELGAGLGAAVDLGIVLRPRRAFEVSIALRDLGAIRWMDRAKRHAGSGSGTYVGASGNVFAEDFAFDFEAVVDGLRDDAQLRSVTEAYTVGLTPKLDAHARYRLGDATDLTATLRTRFGLRPATAATVGLAQRFGELLHVGAHLGRQADQLIYGGRVRVGLGPVSMIAYADTAPVLFDRFAQRTAQVGAGVSLRFGKVRAAKRQGWFDGEPEGGRTTPDNYL